MILSVSDDMDSTPNKRPTIKSSSVTEAEPLVHPIGEIKSEVYQSKAQSSAIFTLTIIIAWYSSNIGVLLLNKYLLSNYGFRYPVFLTMCHMLACSALSYVSIVWLKFMPYQVSIRTLFYLSLSSNRSN